MVQESNGWIQEIKVCIQAMQRKVIVLFCLLCVSLHLGVQIGITKLKMKFYIPSRNSIKINITGCFDIATETSHMGQSYSQADFFFMESPFYILT